MPHLDLLFSSHTIPTKLTISWNFVDSSKIPLTVKWRKSPLKVLINSSATAIDYFYLTLDHLQSAVKSMLTSTTWQPVVKWSWVELSCRREVKVVESGEQYIQFDFYCENILVRIRTRHSLGSVTFPCSVQMKWHANWKASKWSLVKGVGWAL